MRKRLLPVLLAGAIGLPVLIYQDSNSGNLTSLEPNGVMPNLVGENVPAFPASTSFAQSSSFGSPYSTTPQSTGAAPLYNVGAGQANVLPTLPNGYSSTVVLPGTANAPDLGAAPMQFLPTTNLAEIIRFDVSPEWVKRRWQRVSMTPVENELHGMRVALVTGTNASDMHGSLTYHFDAQQRVQRISFQGWAGETGRLVQLLTRVYEFKAQPSHLAGIYVAQNWRRKTGALLMQHPNVIRADNPNQQVAILLEINHPEGRRTLSPSIQATLSANLK